MTIILLLIMFIIIYETFSAMHYYFPVLFSVDICLNLTVQINCQMSLYNHTEMFVPRVDRQ